MNKIVFSNTLHKIYVAIIWCVMENLIRFHSHFNGYIKTENRVESHTWHVTMHWFLLAGWCTAILDMDIAVILMVNLLYSYNECD